MFKKNVLALCADRQGCGTYRIILPYGELAKQGFNIKIDDKMEIPNIPATIVGQRISTEGPSLTWANLSKDKNIRLVYEVDDDLFNVLRSNENAYYFFSHPEILENMEDNIKKSDIVTVTNNHLAEQLKKFNSNIKVLPNFIDEALINSPKDPYIVDGVDVSKFVKIGYAGSPTHQEDFKMVEGQLTKLAQRFNNVLYIWVGAQYHLNAPQIYAGWFTNINEYYTKLSFDIGIAPLVDNTFNRSKSYIKALEYAGRGIPTVASATGPYLEFIKHGETGYLAKTPYEFYKYLKDLVNDEAMRKEMGANALKLAREHTIQKNAHLWAQALELQK